jgi:NTP pyrophosphatase (non-canonical NTP hydrolase)
MTSFGGFKLMEEMGELTQALGKVGPFPAEPHPDGGPPLKDRIEQEMADVLAAINYYVEANGLSEQAIMERAGKKLALFRKWKLTGFDGTVPT